MQDAYCFIPADTKFLKVFTVAQKLQKGRQGQTHRLKISMMISSPVIKFT
jgi:hypothetical protein